MVDDEALFRAVTSDPRYLEHLDWGEPRPGHPEGTIRAHIEELERNLAVLRPKLSLAEYWRLKVLVHVHDAFKGIAKPGAAVVDPLSHASLARTFLESYGVDSELLAVVQFHDEPYTLWRQYQSKGVPSPTRLEALWNTIGDWDLFFAFLIIDGCTAGKSPKPLKWFFHLAADRVASRFNANDIL